MTILGSYLNEIPIFVESPSTWGSVISLNFWSTTSSMGSFDLRKPVLMSNPFVSNIMPQVLSGLWDNASLKLSIDWECYLKSPLEKSSLAMFIPASNILANISMSQHAGPNVQMILVLRESTWIDSKIYWYLILTSGTLFSILSIIYLNSWSFLNVIVYYYYFRFKFILLILYE